MRSMDLLGKLEIYIPVEAEVKNTPLSSLPNSVLRRMGLPLGGKLTDSPECIWICPAVLQRKGQKPASRTGNDAKRIMSSMLGKELQAVPGPCQISFVSANRTAYKVLKDTVPGNQFSTHTSHTSLPQGSALQGINDAVVIYHGHIYLSIKKPNRRRRQQETHELPLDSHSSVPSTSDLSSKSQKKHKDSLEHADKGLQRKKSRVTLPKSNTDQELLNDNKPKEENTKSKVNHSEMHKGSDVSSSTTTHPVSQSTSSVHSHCHKDTNQDQAAEEAAGTSPVWFQSQGEQEEMANQDQDQDQNLGNEAEYIQNSGIGFVGQCSAHSWTRRESQGAACASSSLQDFDFKELAEEEKIARMKAKLRQSEAALNKLHSS